MTSCPACTKESWFCCSNKTCRHCQNTPIEQRRLYKWFIFGLYFPKWFGHYLWKFMWFIHIGHQAERIYHRITGKWFDYDNKFKHFGISPGSFMEEIEECPYCGFTETMDFWEIRGIDEALESEGVSSFSELDEKRNKDK